MTLKKIKLIDEVISDLYKESLQCESTPALKEFRNSCMCSVEAAAAIDLILKERQL